MNGRAWTALLVAAVLGLAGGVWWAQRAAPPPAASVAAGTEGPADPDAPAPEATPTASARAADGTTPATETPRLTALRSWLRDEARAVSRVGVDEQARLRAIQEKLRGFTRTEWNEVARQILDVDGPANERVLSAFMMGLGGFNDLDAVERVFDEKLPEGPTRPHSEEETRALRERSLRLMVIDGLISEAKKDPAKRELLAQAIRRIDDPYLRDLANQRARAEGLQ